MLVMNVKEKVLWYAEKAKSKGSEVAIKMILTLNQLAVPLVTIAALSSMPKAEAGPVSYGLCVEACFAAAAWWCPPAIPVCVTGCIPLLVAPTP